MMDAAKKLIRKIPMTNWRVASGIMRPPDPRDAMTC